jgi:drug/metabolite transporter (DMT)-like permease
MKTKIWVALIAVYIIWGSTYLGIRFAVETIPPFMHAAVRFLISGTLLFVWRRLAGDPAPTRNQWKSAIIIGLLLLVGGNGLISFAEQTIPSGIAALLVATIPLFLTLIEALRPGGAKPGGLQILGLLIGFGGVALLIGPAEFFGATHEFDPAGIGICLLAALLWASGSIYNRSADLPQSTLLFTGMEMLMGSLGLLVMSAATGEFGRLNVAAISTRSLLGLAYLITFGSLVGFVSYGWLLRSSAPVSLVATYAYVNPIVAVLLGSWLAQEALNARILAAALVIVGSVVLINSSKQAKIIQAEETATPISE